MYRRARSRETPSNSWFKLYCWSQSKYFAGFASQTVRESTNKRMRHHVYIKAYTWKYIDSIHIEYWLNTYAVLTQYSTTLFSTLKAVNTGVLCLHTRIGTSVFCTEQEKTVTPFVLDLLKINCLARNKNKKQRVYLFYLLLLMWCICTSKVIVHILVPNQTEVQFGWNKNRKKQKPQNVT